MSDKLEKLNIGNQKVFLNKLVDILNGTISKTFQEKKIEIYELSKESIEQAEKNFTKTVILSDPKLSSFVTQKSLQQLNSYQCKLKILVMEVLRKNLEHIDVLFEYREIEAADFEVIMILKCRASLYELVDEELQSSLDSLQDEEKSRIVQSVNKLNRYDIEEYSCLDLKKFYAQLKSLNKKFQLNEAIKNFGRIINRKFQQKMSNNKYCWEKLEPYLNILPDEIARQIDPNFKGDVSSFSKVKTCIIDFAIAIIIVIL